MAEQTRVAMMPPENGKKMLELNEQREQRPEPHSGHAESREKKNMIQIDILNPPPIGGWL